MVALTFGRDLALSRLPMFFRLGRRAAAEGTRTESERPLWLERMRSGTVGWPNPPFSQRTLSRASRAFAGQILKCSKGSRAVGRRPWSDYLRGAERAFPGDAL